MGGQGLRLASGRDRGLRLASGRDRGLTLASGRDRGLRLASGRGRWGVTSSYCKERGKVQITDSSTAPVSPFEVLKLHDRVAS